MTSGDLKPFDQLFKCDFYCDVITLQIWNSAEKERYFISSHYYTVTCNKSLTHRLDCLVYKKVNNGSWCLIHPYTPVLSRIWDESLKINLFSIHRLIRSTRRFVHKVFCRLHACNNVPLEKASGFRVQIWITYLSQMTFSNIALMTENMFPNWKCKKKQIWNKSEICAILIKVLQPRDFSNFRLVSNLFLCITPFSMM